MGEHTKGPWMRHEDYPKVIVAVAEPTTSLLALDMTDGNEEDPIAIIASDADARLIAAAPELLEALEGLLAATESSEGVAAATVPCEEGCSMCTAQISARTAIAKARGTR